VSSYFSLLSFDEAQARTGSKKLAEVIHKLIYQIIPFSWLMIVNRKIREPFQAGEWFIEGSASTAARPASVFKVRNITQSLLLGEAYSFSETHAAALRRCMPVSIKLIPVRSCSIDARIESVSYIER
jgi:hypothetical protein